MRIFFLFLLDIVLESIWQTCLCQDFWTPLIFINIQDLKNLRFLTFNCNYIRCNFLLRLTCGQNCSIDRCNIRSYGPQNFHCKKKLLLEIDLQTFEKIKLKIKSFSVQLFFFVAYCLYFISTDTCLLNDTHIFCFGSLIAQTMVKPQVWQKH